MNDAIQTPARPLAPGLEWRNSFAGPLPGEPTGLPPAQELQLKSSGLTPYSRIADGRAILRSRDVFGAWLKRYLDRLSGVDRALARNRMPAVNPKYVLRNHLGELAIRDAKLKDNTAVEDLLALVPSPCNQQQECQDKAGFPPDWASQIEIGCAS